MFVLFLRPKFDYKNRIFLRVKIFLLLAFWAYTPHVFLDLFWRCLVIVREVFSDEYFSWHYTFFECYSIFVADGS